MTRIAGGTVVKSGYYWSMSRWSLTGIPAEGGFLPGSKFELYTRVPVLAALLLAPVMGGLFVLFMPFIAIALTVKALARLVTGGAKQGASELAATLAPGAFVPGVAGFTGKPEGEKKEGAAPAASEGIEQLAKEIEEKRQQ